MVGKWNEDGMKNRFNDFCNDMKRVCCEEIDKLKRRIVDGVDKTCQDVEQDLKDVEKTLDDCQMDSELFLPMKQMVSVYNDVKQLDEKLTETKVDEIFLAVDKIGDTSIKQFRNQFQDLLTKVLPSSSSNVDQEQAKYIPRFLQLLRKAAIEDDIDTFKVLLEGFNSPPRSKEFILKYRFEPYDRDHDMYCAEKSCSIWMVACGNDSLQVAQYLLDNCEIDLWENLGCLNAIDILCFNSFNLSETPQKETLIEKILEMDPKLADACDVDQGIAPFERFIGLHSLYLCKIMVEKYGVDVNKPWQDGYWPLMAAIDNKDKAIFDYFLSLGASLASKRTDSNTMLHIACKRDWPYAIERILPSFPHLLEARNGKGESVFCLIFASDCVNALKSIETWFEINPKLRNSRTKQFFRQLAVNKNAQKIIEWLDSAK